MTTRNSPVALSDVSPLPRILIAYSKPYKIVVLCLDFLPLFPENLAYSAPCPLAKAFDPAWISIITLGALLYDQL